MERSGSLVCMTRALLNPEGSGWLLFLQRVPCGIDRDERSCRQRTSTPLVLGPDSEQCGVVGKDGFVHAPAERMKSIWVFGNRSETSSDVGVGVVLWKQCRRFGSGVCSLVQRTCESRIYLHKS